MTKTFYDKVSFDRPCPFKMKYAACDMSSTNGTAQGKDTDSVFNCDTSVIPRPTARGEERLQKGDKFMPDYVIDTMLEYAQGLKDSKEKTSAGVHQKSPRP